MRSPLSKALVAALCLAALASCAWWGDERSAIRTRLREFTERVNTTAPEGLASVSRVAEIGSYFTDDVVVDLGEGTAPIKGRDTLMGMAMRLQPRLSAYRIAFEDANIQLAPDRQSADVTLTAEFIRRDPSPRQSMDAREFKLGMRRVDGEWQIARVTAVDVLK